MEKNHCHILSALHLWLAIAALITLASCVNAYEAGRLPKQRQTFLAAEAALQRGDKVLFNRLQADLKDYPLYPYLLYQALHARLDQNPIGEVRAFFDAYDDLHITPRLRTRWLRQLAKERRWGDFLHDYQPLNDAAMDCWHRQALLYTGRRKAALEGIEQVWMSATSLPEACDPLFKILQDQGGFTRERVWQRFALAMDAGELRLARYLRSLMPAGDRPLAELWLMVERDPAKILEKDRFDSNKPHTAEILMYGLQRWSNRDSVAAAAALDILKQRYRLPEDKVAKLEHRLALYVASRGHPDALNRLNALPSTKVDTAVREWRIRTALQHGDWHATLQWLEQLTPEEGNNAQWQYWRARALEATGNADEARDIYRQLAVQRDYYGFLAADRLDVPYQTQNTPLKVANEHLNTLTRLPGVQRAQELYLLQRYGEARLEWMRAIRDLSQEDLQKAAKLAQQWGWHDRSIVTLARADYWDDLELRFPLPYQDQVMTRARDKDIDPAWIYAIMRQESTFQPDIKSHAGALGLMQIMPATGQYIAKDAKTNLANSYHLLQADTNIDYGTRYLRLTLEQLQGNPLLATAAYNAGPHRVRQWLPEHKAIEADIWAETIPYFETRQYVKRVMEYTAIYEQRLGQTVNSLRSRMPPILPVSQQ